MAPGPKRAVAVSPLPNLDGSSMTKPKTLAANPQVALEIFGRVMAGRGEKRLCHILNSGIGLPFLLLLSSR